MMLCADCFDYECCKCSAPRGSTFFVSFQPEIPFLSGSVFTSYIEMRSRLLLFNSSGFLYDWSAFGNAYLLMKC